MDYYEELGLSKAASLDEIHQGYRQLARLVHPDQQPDDDLRRLAETQMKRLNMILEVLSDPAQRRQYDMSLEPPVAKGGWPSTLPEIEPAHPILWIWMAAVLVGIAAIGSFFGYCGGTWPAPVKRASAVPGSPAVPEEARGRPPKATHVSRRKPAAATPIGHSVPPPVQESGKVKPKEFSGLELRTAPDLTIAQPELALAIPQIPPPAPAPSADRPSPPGFRGIWLYVPPVQSGEAKGFYAPEYIEVNIAEDGGQVQGQYRARYQITDRAISPAVVFRFAGRAAAPLSTLKWNGPGGAYGRVTLKLVGENSLEVSWTANRLSEELGLISGVATLVRRREP